MKQKLTEDEQFKRIESCKVLSSRTRTVYDFVDRVFCQALQKNIVFNAKGFHHLHYKPDGTARTVNERIHKLRLFPLAVAVIRNATSIGEEREIVIFKSRKKNTRKVKAKQYALVATVGRRKPVRVRVIIMDIENSQNPIFWSIMKD